MNSTSDSTQQQAGNSAPSEYPPILNKRKMEALRRRADHLAARIASSELRDLSYDKQELSALQHALALIEAHGLCTVEGRNA